MKNKKTSLKKFIPNPAITFPSLSPPQLAYSYDDRGTNTSKIAVNCLQCSHTHITCIDLVYSFHFNNCLSYYTTPLCLGKLKC